MPFITSSTHANYSSPSSNIETRNNNNLSSPTVDRSTERINSYIQDKAVPSPRNQQSSIEDSIHVHTARLERYLQEFNEAMAGYEISEGHPSPAVVNFSESLIVTDVSANGSANSQHSSTTNEFTNRINRYVQDPITSIPEGSPYLTSPASQIIQAQITKIQNNLADFDKSFYK